MRWPVLAIVLDVICDSCGVVDRQLEGPDCLL